MKVCRWCVKEMPTTEFHRRGKSGYQGVCKCCIRQYQAGKRFNLPVQSLPENTGAANCDCCGRVYAPLVVDHDRHTGVVRGFLCRACNAGIGMFGDNVESIKKALAYLERQPPTDVPH